MQGFHHISVLATEVMHYLAPKPGGIYVDGTLGGAGHARQILEASTPDGLLIGFDRDREAIAAATGRLSGYGDRVRLIQKSFARLADTLTELGIAGIDGLLLDVGVSSYQLDTVARGFSFQHDAPLDMRMDASSGQSAADLVNTLAEADLSRIIREYGEERWAKRIAAFIVERRKTDPIETTLQLVDVIKGAVPRGAWDERLHPATRTFQALRIAVNEELTSLEKVLNDSMGLLNRGGRVVVISFHSLEDRIVKNSFRSFAHGCTCPKRIPRCICGKVPQIRILTGKPVMAGDAEVAINPRSRSAKLRAAEKI